MSTSPPVNKLRAAMQGMAGTPQPTSSVAAIVPTEPTASKAARPPSRRGKRVVSAYIEATAAKQMRLLAVELDTSTQALLEEALNDLFRKYNRSALA
jgi:hypothetical protein